MDLEEPNTEYTTLQEHKDEENNNNESCLIVQTVLIPETMFTGGHEGEGWAEKLSWERSETKGRAENGRKESLVHRAAEALGLDEKAVAGEEFGLMTHPATLILVYTLATLHSLLGVDLLQALSYAILIICMLCLILT